MGMLQVMETTELDSMQEAFDLVLMDVQLPVMDGVEATRRIRSSEAGEDKKHVPIIAMTAYAMPGDQQRILEAGMDSYMSKPVDFKVLEKEMGAVLGQDGE